MEKKRVLMVNLLALAVVLLMVLAALLASKLIPRQTIPYAGPLELEFEPSLTMEPPETEDAGHPDWTTSLVCKEDAI